MNRLSASSKLLQLIPFNYNFDIISSSKSFFFDENTGYFFETIHSDVSTLIKVSGLVDSKVITVTIRGSSEIHNMRINPELTLLFVQRSAYYVEFVNLSKLQDSNLVSIRPKRTDDYIRSVYFINSTSIALVAGTQVEIYEMTVKTIHMRLKLVFRYSSNWELFCFRHSFLVIASGDKNLHLRCMSLKDISRRNMVETVLIPTTESDINLNSNDCCFVSLYDASYLCIMGISPNIPLYHFDTGNKTSFVLKYTLETYDLSGHYFVSVIDNLVAVHDYNKRVSCMYDINVHNVSSDGIFMHCEKLFDDSAVIQIDSFPITSKLHAEAEDIFSDVFLIHYPDYMFDSNKGLIYQFHINLDMAVSIFRKSIFDLINFLYHRSDGKYILLSHISNVISSQIVTVSQAKNIFLDIRIYNEMFHVKSDPNISNPIICVANFIEQDELYANLFYPLLNSCNDLDTQQLHTHLCYLETLLFFYITSLTGCVVPVKSFIVECLIEVIVRLGKITQLKAIISSNLFVFDQNVVMLLIRMCKNHPVLIPTVMNICYKTDCVDGLLRTIVQLEDPAMAKRLLLALNSTDLYARENGEKIKLLSEIKITEEFLNHDIKVNYQNTPYMEIVFNYLKTLSFVSPN